MATEAGKAVQGETILNPGTPEFNEAVNNAASWADLPPKFKTRVVGSRKVSTTNDDGSKTESSKPVMLTSAWESGVKNFLEKFVGEYGIPMKVITSEFNRLESAYVIQGKEKERDSLLDSIKGMTDASAMMKVMEKIAAMNTEIESLKK